ncbi:anti-anti-sigma regulatory factor [Crossiella equi]|uniref:Anti-anti-sigma regulatory factor n=1 Tax=Crossiella equi TaxID=130796 RepID=A0ABS5ALF3_9PSEU|nr:STAS domain-containing protein [Crossiella equi]MBP2476500.1 anti-anti-sigma regulatory factor [Crossiella equi]
MSVEDSVLLTRVEHTGEASVLRVEGVLDSSSYSQLRDVLLHAVDPAPSALVVDLSRLTARTPAPLSVFAVVRLSVARWPGVPLLLAGPGPELRAVMARSTVLEFVPVHPSVRDALDSVLESPPRVRVRFSVPVKQVSPQWVAEVVGEVCRNWGVEQSGAAATTVAERLIFEALAGDAAWGEGLLLRVELCAGLLTVAVRVADPFLPPLGGGVDRELASVVHSWGYTPTGDGRRVAWATIRTSAG